MNFRLTSFLCFVFLLIWGGCTHSLHHYQISARGVVASSNAEILEYLKPIELGNAFDLAVAGAFLQAVVAPHLGGLGGGGMAMVQVAAENNKIEWFDFTESAPALAHPHMFQRDGVLQTDLRFKGYLAVATPGFVGGLAKIHQKYGSLSWSEVLQPSINLASEYSKIEIQNALNLIAQQGAGAFYQGPIGQAILSSLKTNQTQKAFLSLKDLDQYQVDVLFPQQVDFQNFQMVLPQRKNNFVALLPSLLKAINEPGAMAQKNLESGNGFLQLAQKANQVYTQTFNLPKSLDKLNAGERTFFLNQELANHHPMGMQLMVRDRFNNTIILQHSLFQEKGSGVWVEPFGFFLNNSMARFFAEDPKQYQQVRIAGLNRIRAQAKPLNFFSQMIVLEKGEFRGALAVDEASLGFVVLLESFFHFFYHPLGLDDGAFENEAPFLLLKKWFSPNYIASRSFQVRSETEKDFPAIEISNQFPEILAVVKNHRNNANSVGKAYFNEAAAVVKMTPKTPFSPL